MSNKKFEKMFEHLLKLFNLSEREEIINGDSFIEFTDRKIEIIDPKEFNRIFTKNMNVRKPIRHYKRKSDVGKIYGKSILETIKPKKKKK